jgi:hypothetical protein
VLSRSSQPPAPTTPSFRAQQADASSFTFASCERIGLRSEKSLLGFFLF